jgi:hypothetical protein
MRPRGPDVMSALPSPIGEPTDVVAENDARSTASVEMLSTRPTLGARRSVPARLVPEVGDAGIGAFHSPFGPGRANSGGGSGQETGGS